MRSWSSLISGSNERPAASPSLALFHHRGPRRYRFTCGGLAASDPAGGQPAVEGLEESTGLQLFNRTPGGFTLTEAGAALLPLAHKAVSASSDFRTMADSLKESMR